MSSLPTAAQNTSAPNTQHLTLNTQHLTPNTQHLTPSAPSVILILTEGFTLADLQNPGRRALYEFARTGRIAMMAAPTAGRKSDRAAMLALASGSLAAPEPSDDEAFMLRERHPEGDSAADVFRRRSSHPIPSRRTKDAIFPYSGEAVHLGIASLARRNLHSRLIGSWLGDKSPAAAGNADTQEPHRGAALFATDAQGWIPDAFLGREVLSHNPSAPFARSDSPELLAAWAMSRSDADLITLHLGDLARADSARQRLTAKQFTDAHRHALNRLDALLSSLNSRARSRKVHPRILLVSTRPPLNVNGGWDRLSVAVLGRAGAAERPGLLTSATTRTAGLISNLDIAPTILTWLDRPIPPHMTGHPIANDSGPRSELERIDTLARLNAQGLVPIFVILGVIAAFVGLGGFTAVSMGAGARLAGFLFLALSNFPLGMLLVVWTYPRSLEELGRNIGLTILALAALECVIGSILQRFRHEFSAASGAVIALAALTAAGILLDALTGQSLIKFSLFSGYQVTGIRFYGVGNEYMGVLVGMALLYAFLARIPLLQAGVLFIVTGLSLGLPSLGADAGGFVTSVVAFGTAGFILTGRRAGWQAASALTLIGFAGAFGLAYLDRAVSGAESSHLGAAIQIAEREGWQALLQIIERKLRMNAAILFNPYTLVAIAGSLVIAFVLGGPLRAQMKVVLAQNPGWARGLPSAGWGALAALLFNDSGAVPAIFIMGSFLAGAVILLFFESRSPRREDFSEL